MKGIKYDVYWNGTDNAILIAPYQIIRWMAQEIEDYNETLNDSDKDD